MGRPVGAPSGAERRERRLRRAAMKVVEGEVCPHGRYCTFGLRGACRGVHTAEEVEKFDKVREFYEWRSKGGCPHAKRHCCRFGSACRRCVKQDSDYEESGGEDGSDEVVEATVVQEERAAIS